MLLLFGLTPAFAFDSGMYPYVGVTLGSALTSVSKLTDASASLKTDFDPGPMAGLTAGIAFDSELGWNIDRLRAEVEVGYRSNDLVRMKNNQGQRANMKGKVSVVDVMLNGYLENTSLLAEEVPLKLFLTAGAGTAMASISSIDFQGNTIVKSASDTQLAYQGGAGLGYELTKRITLDMSYRYLGTTKFKFGGINAEYGSHNILLGARYAFK
jgi:opacity protein-like surface antigen